MTKIKIDYIATVSSDFVRLEIITKELEAILEREAKRPLSYEHLGASGQEVVETVVEMLNEYLNWQPGDEDLIGEPPLSSKEMLDAAWKQHLELHS